MTVEPTRTAILPGPRLLLLGALRVVDDSGEVHDLRGRAGTVLAALAVGEGSPVSSDRLIDILWGDRLPASPDNALHTVISRLRTALEPLGLDERVVTEAGGYRLVVGADEVDARRFEAAVGAVEGPADVAGVQRLRSALGLWRGPALEGLRASHPHFSAEADRLDSLWFTGVETTIEADLMAGRYRSLVPELVALTARYPTRETLWGFLMEALYLSGRQAEALAAFRSARTHLAAELGLEPSASLVALEDAILRHEPVPSMRAATSVGRLEDGVGGLPRLPDGYADRAMDLEALDRLVARHQLVSVAGVVGVGKTALVRVWAHRERNRFGGGIWWIDARLDASEDGPVASVDEAVARLAALLGDERAVVVVDNADRVRAGAARAARNLAERNPASTVIVVACEPFSFTGGGGMRIAPLSSKDAADLLVARVAMLSGDDDPPQPSPGLLGAVGGHPLAIEIAAGAIALDGLRPDDVIDALPHLVHHDPEADPRHRTLATALDAVLDQLSEADRRAIDILARFDEPRSFQACAEAVGEEAGGGEPASAVVARLLSVSLLRAEAAGLDIIAPIRRTVRARARGGGGSG